MKLFVSDDGMVRLFACEAGTVVTYADQPARVTIALDGTEHSYAAAVELTSALLAATDPEAGR